MTWLVLLLLFEGILWYSTCLFYDSFASVLYCHRLLFAILFFFVVVCNDTPWNNNVVIFRLPSRWAWWFYHLILAANMPVLSKKGPGELAICVIQINCICLISCCHEAKEENAVISSLTSNESLGEVSSSPKHFRNFTTEETHKTANNFYQTNEAGDLNDLTFIWKIMFVLSCHLIIKKDWSCVVWAYMPPKFVLTCLGSLSHYLKPTAINPGHKTGQWS